MMSVFIASQLTPLAFRSGIMLVNKVVFPVPLAARMASNVDALYFSFIYK